MTGLGLFRRSEEERAEISARRSAAALARHARRRETAILEVAKWPGGATPMPGLSEDVLRGLEARGLVERRWILTRDGETEARRLQEASEP